MQQKCYPSKILLFGEYTVLFGGQALAIPHPRYCGRWVKTKTQPEYNVSGFLDYVKQINNLLHSPLNLHSLDELIRFNTTFESNIPPGIGLGSSGALSASIYDQCADPGLLSLEDKKSDLATIESYFHGRSSGFDALISFENKCIVQTKTGLKIISNLPLPPLDVFLLYTGIQRDSQPLIERFQKKSASADFRNEMENLAAFSSNAIEAFIKGQISTDHIKRISISQFENLQFLIEPSLRDLWKESLDHPDFTMKICGAGGGGCYLVFSSGMNLPQIANKFKLEKVDFKPLCTRKE